MSYSRFFLKSTQNQLITTNKNTYTFGQELKCQLQKRK